MRIDAADLYCMAVECAGGSWRLEPTAIAGGANWDFCFGGSFTADTAWLFRFNCLLVFVSFFFPSRN